MSAATGRSAVFEKLKKLFTSDGESFTSSGENLGETFAILAANSIAIMVGFNLLATGFDAVPAIDYWPALGAAMLLDRARWVALYTGRSKK